ncbi:MAG: HNH endonuclease [Planctomycetes bacterium]|nr:HNH endonuclease [Planctomycetota bacterium]
MEAVLDQRTLVLNRSWVAIDTTTVRKALVWMYRGLARAIAPESFETHDFASWTDLSVNHGDPCIHTINLQIRVPEIIILALYNEVPKKEVVFSRRNIYKRDRFTCQYCGEQPGSEELTIDHILPRAKGGKSSWENCVLACVECNRAKANRTPAEAGMLLKKAAVRPPWTPFISLKLGTRRASWERFVSERYWDIELEE